VAAHQVPFPLSPVIEPWCAKALLPFLPCHRTGDVRVAAHQVLVPISCAVVLGVLLYAVGCLRVLAHPLLCNSSQGMHCALWLLWSSSGELCSFKEQGCVVFLLLCDPLLSPSRSPLGCDSLLWVCLTPQSRGQVCYTHPQQRTCCGWCFLWVLLPGAHAAVDRLTVLHRRWVRDSWHHRVLQPGRPPGAGHLAWQKNTATWQTCAWLRGASSTSAQLLVSPLTVRGFLKHTRYALHYCTVVGQTCAWPRGASCTSAQQPVSAAECPAAHPKARTHQLLF